MRTLLGITSLAAFMGSILAVDLNMKMFLGIQGTLFLGLASIEHLKEIVKGN